MAINFTQRYVGQAAASSLNSDFFTVSEDSILVAMVSTVDATGYSITTTGLTWENLIQAGSSGNAQARISICRIPRGFGQKKIQAVLAVTSATAVSLVIYEINGADMVNAYGLSQSDSGTNRSGAYSFSLGGTSLAGSIVFVAASAVSGTITAGTGVGYTNIFSGSTGTLTYGTEYLTPGRITTMNWNDLTTTGTWAVGALEIVAEPTPHTISPEWNGDILKVLGPNLPKLNATGQVANTNVRGVITGLLKPSVSGKISNDSPASTFSMVRTGSAQWGGAVLSPSGEIHYIPILSPVGQKINKMGVVSTYSLVHTLADGAYVGAAMAGNGDIHLVPHNANVGQKIAPDGTVSTYSLLYTTSFAYAGGVTGPDGSVHFINQVANRGQKVSATGVVSTYALVNTSSGTALYQGGILAPNGDIHFIPSNATVGQKIAANNVVSTYTLADSGANYYIGAVVAPNGDIHFIPYNAPRGQKIDVNGIPSTYTLVAAGSFMYAGGVLAPNGDIHFVPWGATVGQKISADGTVSTYNIPVTTGSQYWGGILDDYGNVIFIGRSANHSLRIHTGSARNFSLGMRLTPYMNKAE